MRNLALCAALLAPGAALAWTEPPRGSELRTDLMDAIRPIAEYNFGAPVEFVIRHLRVEGDVAFAAVSGQRPGGGEIDLRQTPIVERGELDPGFSDGPTMHVLYQRAGRTWVAVVYSTGATDAWYTWDAYCPIWGAVLPDSCGGAERK